MLKSSFEKFKSYYALKKEINEVKKLIADEVNVEEVKNIKGEVDVKLETRITDLLKQKGEVRDIIRKIQEERKKIGTNLDQEVDVSLPNWSKEFEKDIKKKALVRNLSKGDFKVVKL